MKTNKQARRRYLKQVKKMLRVGDPIARSAREARNNPGYRQVLLDRAAAAQAAAEREKADE